MTTTHNESAHTDGDTDIRDIARTLWRRRRLVLGGSLTVARTTLLPPQQQSSAMSALAALGGGGALAGLAGGMTGLKSASEQYVAMLESVTVKDRIIERFKLKEVYDEPLASRLRDKLGANTDVKVDKKSGLISIEVDDKDAERAANIANRYVAELIDLTGKLALTEAQQRRVFFEDQLKKSKRDLTQAQIDLQGSGFSQSDLKTDPVASAEAYGRLRAEITAAEVKLQTMRQSLRDNATEMRLVSGELAALRGQLQRLEQDQIRGARNGPDYISKFREFKYQETLFELMAKQFEMARIDESRDGPLTQVLDPAQTPDWKSKPKRGIIAVLAGIVSFFMLSLFVLFREALGPRPD